VDKRADKRVRAVKSERPSLISLVPLSHLARNRDTIANHKRIEKCNKNSQAVMKREVSSCSADAAAGRRIARYSMPKPYDWNPYYCYHKNPNLFEI